MSSKHIVPLPAYTFRLRLAQIVIAPLVLVLNVVGLAILGGYGAFGYGVFTPLSTCVIVAYWYHANYRRQHAYNRWVILILDCFAVVWWLSLWSVLASWAGTLGLVSSIDNSYGVSSVNVKIVYALTAVSAVLGAAEFVLFVVTLVSFSIRLHAARRSESQGKHGTPFPNPNYQQMQTGAAAGTHPGGQKPEFQVSTV